MKNQLIRFLFIFSLVWLVFSLFGIGQKPKEYTDDIVILAKNEFTFGAPVSVEILNNTDKAIAIPNDCSKTPLTTEKYENGMWKAISAARISQKGCVNPVAIASKQKQVVSYTDETNTLFGQEGKYRVSVQYEGKQFSHEFEMKEPGIFKKAWNLFVYEPVYNLLIWLIEVVPGHSLGLAIILFTIIVKTALLIPNHKALKSQKALQKIQPELQKIKDQFKGDQARIAQETMGLWKKHKINPAGSFLPILLQFPFLIAMFVALKQGLSQTHSYFLYDALKDFNFGLVDPHFLMMNLAEFGPWYLAIMVGGLQFFQMKLTFAQKAAQQTSMPAVGGSDMLTSQMDMMNKVFTYVMPVMITFFTFTTPAGVGLYWGISTLYAIFQQQVVNKVVDKMV